MHLVHLLSQGDSSTTFVVTGGIEGTIGGTPILVLGGFIGGGVNVGFTDELQLFISFSHTEMFGSGAFLGVTPTAGGGVIDGPLPTGISTETLIQAEANLGFGETAGGTMVVGPNGASVTRGRAAGVGFGAMIAVGRRTQTTIASPPMLPWVMQTLGRDPSPAPSGP